MGVAPPGGSRRRLKLPPHPGSLAPPDAGLGSHSARGGRTGGGPQVSRGPRGRPACGPDGRAAPREGAGRSGRGAARGRRRSRRSHVRAPAPPQPGRDVISRAPAAAAPHSRPPRGRRRRCSLAGASPPRPTCARLRGGCRGRRRRRRRPQDDARGSGGSHGGAAPPRSPRPRRGCARGLRTDGGGGASGGRREVPRRRAPASSPSAESWQALPSALDQSRSAAGAGCAAIGLGAGPRAPGMTR